MINFIAAHFREHNRFPKFNDARAYEVLYQKIIENAVDFLKYEMYKEMDTPTVLELIHA